MTEAEKVQRNMISRTEPTGVLDHECSWCGETIPAGQKHVRVVYGTHKQRVTKRYHIHCWEEM